MKSQGFLMGIRRFIKMEDGLVTVEWVALTAGMVIAAVAIGFTVMNNTKQAASKVGGGISTAVTKKYGSNF
jgi:hypothetical protein